MSLLCCFSSLGSPLHPFSNAPCVHLLSSSISICSFYTIDTHILTRVLFLNVFPPATQLTECHLIVLSHGLWGTSDHFNYIEETLQETVKAKYPEKVLPSTKQNPMKNSRPMTGSIFAVPESLKKFWMKRLSSKRETIWW